MWTHSHDGYCCRTDHVPQIPPVLRGPELKERVAPSLGDVLLECVVDADPVPAEEGDGWPEARSEQRAKQERASERLERASKDGSRLLGREFDGLNRNASIVISNGCLTGRPKVCRPASLAVGRLDEPASIELEHGHRYRVRPARPPSAHRQENVRCTGWHSRGNQPACKRVDQAEEPSGDQLAQVGPRA
jgi:hypothetical protein